MALSSGKLPYWLENASDSSQSQIEPAQTDQISSSAIFNQLLDQLNASQWQTNNWSKPGSWHDDPQSTDSTANDTSSLSSTQLSSTVPSSAITLSGHAINWDGTHFHQLHSFTPDHPGTLTVTSSGDGFAEGDVVTAHVTDPDGIKA